MIKDLQIFNVGEKIRVGSKHDGGYILPKIALDKSDFLFSYGVERNIEFEEEYIELSGNTKKVYAFDHTIDGIPTKYEDNFFFNKEGLSSTKTDFTNNFLEHYNNSVNGGKALLKIDVEGCEYEYFNNTSIEDINSKVIAIAIEFHHLSNDIYRNNFFEIIKKLNKYFYICHIHGNNCGEQFLYKENGKLYKIPDVIELTFVSKLIVNSANVDTSYYPTNLDTPNTTEREDYSLSFINYEIKTYKDLKNYKIEDNGGIPKILFRSSRISEYHLPNNVKEVYIKDLINNEGYELFYFDDTDCEQFIKDTNNQDFIDCYEKLIPTAFKSDLFRAILLYTYGGVWMDFSHVALKNYDYIINGEKEVFIKDKSDLCGINNSFMACMKGNEVLKCHIELTIDNIKNERKGLRIFEVTGPQLLEIAYRKVYNISDEIIPLPTISNSLKLTMKDYDLYNEDTIVFMLNEKGEKVIQVRAIHNHYSLNYGDKSLRYDHLFNNGLLYKDQRWYEIEKLYNDLLLRKPDLFGISHYYISHLDINQISSIFSNSEEYFNIMNNITKIYTYKDFKELNFEDNGQIPKIIIKTGSTKVDELHEDIKNLYYKIIKSNPKYKLFYFDDEDREQFVKDLSNDRIYNAYCNLIPKTYQADLFRYLIMYYYGGIYMDFSMSPIINIDDIIKKYKQVYVNCEVGDYIIKEYWGKYYFEGIEKNPIIYNAFIATIKGTPILKYCIDLCVKNIENKNYGFHALCVTSPMILGQAFKELNINDVYVNDKIRNGEISNELFIYITDSLSKEIKNPNSGESVINCKIENHYEILYNGQKNTFYYLDLWENKSVFKN